MIQKNCLGWVFITLLCCVATSLDMVAQNANEVIDRDTIYSLQAVVVTGHRKPKMSKLDVALKDIPVTISNISMEPLKIRGIFNIEEALRYSPAVNTRTTYGAFQQISVRGFDYSPVELDGMRDERTTFNSYPIPDLSMVEKIEVVKGPSSVLSGHSSVGGSINIVRKSATNTPLLELFLSSGSWNRQQVTGTISGRISDHINSLLNINRSWGDGWRGKDDRRFSIYNNTNFILSNNSSLDLRLSYVQDFYATETGLPATMPGNIFRKDTDEQIYKEGEMLRGLNMSTRYNSSSDFMWNKSWNAYLRYNLYLQNGWKLSNKAMYSHDIIDYFNTEELSYPTLKAEKYNELSSADQARYPYYYMSGQKKNYIDIDHVVRTFPLRFCHVAKTFQDHFDINGKFDIGSIHNHIMLGASYTLMNRVSYSGYSVAPAPSYPHNTPDKYDVYGPGVNAPIDSYNPEDVGPMYERFGKATPTKTQVLGLFLQDMLEISDQFKAFIALRYNHYRLDNYEKTAAIDRTTKYKRGKNTSSIAYNSLTYRLGLVYEPNENISLYGSYANFFVPHRRTYQTTDKTIYLDKRGKEMNQKNMDFGKAIFDPLTGYQAELGTSFAISDCFEGRISGYHIQQRNVVKTIGTVEGTNNEGQVIQKSVVAQAGSVLASGAEAELNYRPLHNLFISLGYGYNFTRFGHIAKNDLGLKGTDKGDRLNYIPMHTLFSFGNYTFTKGALKGLDFNYSVTYTDKIYRIFGKKLAYEPYALLNIGARYIIPKCGLSIGLQMNNVLNKLYFPQSLGMQNIPGEPRNMKLIVSYKIW